MVVLVPQSVENHGEKNELPQERQNQARWGYDLG
jgi:hypothetical protein